jgi:hypothetical protein
MSNWLVAIVGGAIATVLGGMILFYLQPQPQQTPAPPALTAPVSSSAAREPSGARYLRCTMRGGTMGGNVYTFAVDTSQAAVMWTDNATPLEVVHIDEMRIHTRLERKANGWPLRSLTTSTDGWPQHDYISFNFNRVTRTVEGGLTREPTAQDCQAPGSSYLCNMVLVGVGQNSRGDCSEVVRSF